MLLNSPVQSCRQLSQNLCGEACQFCYTTKLKKKEKEKKSPRESQFQYWLNIMCGWKFEITAKVSQEVVIHCKDKLEVIEEFPKFTPHVDI
jgi:hypothetical protein